MRSTFRIRPELAVVVLLVGLAGIGWVARTTMAQKSSQKPAELLPVPASPGGELKVPLSAPVPSLPPAPVVSARSPFELDPASGLLAPGENDDPEKNVQAFVEQNRKVAETQLKNLRGEAEKLRARLQKVETGIRRWETLVTALQTNDAHPGDLEPIPPARRGFNARAVPPPVVSREEAPNKPPPAPSGELSPPTPSEPLPR